MTERLVEKLKGLLVGSWFTHVEYEEQWRLRTESQVWLIAQSVRVSFEGEIEAALRARDPSLLQTVDAGLAPRAAAVFRMLRYPIDEVRLDREGALGLRIAGGWLTAEVDTDIVDWQWSVSRTRQMPFVGFDVARIWRGSVEDGESPQVRP